MDLDGLGPLPDTPGPVVVATSHAGLRGFAPGRGAGPDTAFRIASLTKPLTAAACVLATDESGVNLATPVLDVLPQLRPDWRADRSLTLADLLSQTSGLAPAVSADDAAALGESDEALLDAARLVVRAGSTRPPGQRWEYDNGNYFLAGAVLAHVRGTTYETALEELVLGPWGLRRTSFVGADSYPRGRRPSGGLRSSTRDLLTAGERLLERPALLARLGRRRTAPDDPMPYGYGWAIGPSGQLFLNGRLPGCRAVWLIVPEHAAVVVALAADTDALPGLARVVSALQEPLTGDDLETAIRSFAE